MSTCNNKKVKKTLLFYHFNFGFFPPYNILIDATFCYEALETKIQINEQLPVYLDSAVNIVTTQCIIQEVENLSKAFKKLLGAWLIVKTFKVHKCGHSKKPRSASKCIMSMLGHENPSRYIVATMDKDLAYYIRNNVKAAPILHLFGHSPILDRPLDKHREYIDNYKSKPNYELETLREIKEKLVPEPKPKPRKRKQHLTKERLWCLKSQKVKIHSIPNPDSKKSRRKRNKANKDILLQNKDVFATDAQKIDKNGWSGTLIPSVPVGTPNH